MATLTPYSDINLVEMAKRRFNGKQLSVVMQLAQRNELLMGAPMVEANDVYTNVSSRWKTLPKPTPRSINSGGNKDRLEVEQVRDSIMLLDVQVEIDEALIDHEPDRGKAIMTETRAHLEGTSQQIAFYMIYGNPSTDSREPIGLATRRSSLGTNCVDIGGSGGDTTSIFIVEWDPLAMKFIYPRGASTMGVDVRDHGKQRVTDASNNPFYAYCHQVVVELGNSVVDERNLQRLANIETTLATNNLIDSDKVRELVKAYGRLPNLGQNAVIYGNRTTVSQMNIYALEKSNGFYTVDDITGRPLATFQGIPIRMVEQIADDETQVT